MPALVRSGSYKKAFHYNNHNDARKEPALTIPVPKESLAILIGTAGRNICLVVKCANVFIQTNEDSIDIFTRNAHSDVDLARRMVTSIIAGGVLRWFNHPSTTNKYYHVSVREELKELVATMTDNKCTLDLLRSHTGHLCLFVSIQPKDLDDATVITNMRPIVLEKINQLAAAASSSSSSLA